MFALLTLIVSIVIRTSQKTVKTFIQSVFFTNIVLCFVKTACLFVMFLFMFQKTKK